MMNTVRRLALTLSLVAAATTPALADGDGPVTHTDQLVVVTPNPPVVITNGAAVAPSAGPSTVAPQAAAPQAAPQQNEDWNNVSHINGQIVKVGERGDYLYKFKKTNISTNPIGYMFGFYGLSVSRALTTNIAIRVDANLMDFDNTSGYELGVSLPIYFKRMYSGPFIEPGLITRGFRDTYDYAYDCYDCSSYNDTDTMVGPEVLFGWHWIFDSGLNVAFAFGAARDMSGSDSEYDSSVEPAGYFRVGYAF